MKTALVHDWLMTLGGAENVFAEIYKLFPGPIYTLFAREDSIRNSAFRNADISTSFLQKLPFAKRKYRSYLPFYPLAVEQFDLSQYDVIISSSHAVAKNVLTATDQIHICYFNGMMAYAYDLHHYYLKETGLKKYIKGPLARSILQHIRSWDYTARKRPDYCVANSHYMARMVEKHYDRESTVIYPPVDTENIQLTREKEDYYLAAARLVPIKRLDTIVDAFSSNPERKLVILGDGPEMSKLKSRAADNITFLGHRPHDEVFDYMSKARALVTASVEPFGITTVEAQACGTPVIAYGRGGSLETVIDGRTGIFFDKQDPDCLNEAIEKFEKVKDRFDAKEIRENAMRFSKERFQAEFKAFVEDAVRRHRARIESKVQRDGTVREPAYIEDFETQESPEPAISD
ncbi:MAG: glycosyltransferase [Candidatus Zixiibacteriota bacterium]|nr:MAG: glycosyltransferase [candidate division Zixibacteria bacterium]